MDRDELHLTLTQLFESSRCKHSLTQGKRQAFDKLRRYFSLDLRPPRIDRGRWFDSARTCWPPWFELALDLYWRGDITKSRPEKVLLDRIYEVVSIFIGAGLFSRGTPAEVQLQDLAANIEVRLCQLLDALYNPNRMVAQTWLVGNDIDNLLGTTDTNELIDELWKQHQS